MTTSTDTVLLPVTAAILAGGRSMRMGVDKILLPVEGTPMLTRAIEAVVEVCAHVVVVTNRPEDLRGHVPDDVTVLQDAVAYQGPLGALATVLADAPDEWVLAVGADMPWVQPAVIRALWAARGAAQVVVPLTPDGPEPLLALYHKDCLPAATQALGSGRRRIVAMFRHLKVVEVPVEDLRSVDPDLVSLFNVNTPEDLIEAEETEPVQKKAPAGPVVVLSSQDRHEGRLPSERPITVYMNEVEIATIQSSPTDLEEMAAGFLLAEGLMADRSALTSIDADYPRGLVYIKTAEAVPDDMVYKTRYITSGCGKGITFSSVGHAKGLEHITSDVRVNAKDLLQMIHDMSTSGEQRHESGGVHGCAFGRDGKLLYIREDIGRHNAVDKLLGRAWMDDTPTDDLVLLSTGRVSYEMAVKAAKARVPVVVSRHAVTDLAAEITEELGITLVAYCRGNRMVVCTHPERIVNDIEED